MARFMIVRGSEPLEGAEVRVEGCEGTEQTDDEGRIEVDVDDPSFGGPVEVSVRHSGESYDKEIDFDPKSSLVVVNVADPSDRETNGEGPVHSTQSGPFQARSMSFDERFDVEGRLGTGGMGVVVKARDQTLGRTVAIKILSEELAAQEEAREIFMREVRHLATLDHPNLVRVYDVVEEADRPFMITEYVEGLTLEQVLQSQEVLPQSSVLKVAVQLCRAVEYLHSQETVHRDIKPGNIMLKGDGTLKIIDFGLARSFKQLTDKGTRVRGTPAYMAPEQIEGGELSRAIDIYQIGVTLHEIAAGELPFNEGDISYKHVHEQPPYLLDQVPNILPGLADLVRLCLSKDPDDRPASATVVREEVERLYQLLTSSRVDRETISNPNIGGNSDSDLRVDASDSGAHGAVAPGASNLRDSNPGTGEASSTRPRSEARAVEDLDDDSEDGGWRGKMVWLAAGLLLAAGIGGYVVADGGDGPQGGGESGAVAASTESSEAESEEEETKGAAAAAESTEEETQRPVRSASAGVEEALLASNAAAESAADSEEESDRTAESGRTARDRGQRRRGRARDPSGGARTGGGGRASDSSKTGSGAPANARESDETGESEGATAEKDDSEPSEPSETKQDEEVAAGAEEPDDPGAEPSETTTSGGSDETEPSEVDSEPETANESVGEPESDPVQPEPSEPSEPVEPADEPSEPSESASASGSESAEPAEESSDQSKEQEDEESDEKSVPMSF